MKLRYDALGASQHKESRHPAEVLKALRISYSRYEGCPVADCIFIHDAILSVDYLPPFIDVVDDVPTVSRTISDSQQMREYALSRVEEFADGIRKGEFNCKAASLDIAGFEAISFLTSTGERFAVRIPERKV